MKKVYILIAAVLAAIFASACTEENNNKAAEDTGLVYLFQHISDSSPLADELRKKTGVNIKFITYGDASVHYSELLSMLASSNLPDIIVYPWNDYPGGPEKAISDGIIIPLNDIIDSYSPNLKKYINEHPHIKKDIISDSGNYYAYPFIREQEEMRIYEGPFFRKDWLDSLKLPVPETISEWETTLTRFKDELGATHPLANINTSFGTNPIAGAFGIGSSFYVDNNTVHYGPYEPAYREYLSLLKSWYENGLLGKTPNLTPSDQDVKYKVATGKSGAHTSPIGSGMGQIYAICDNYGSNIELTAVPYPVLNKGDVNRFGHYDNDYCQYAISKSCKNVELAAKVLDFGYSKEGMLTYNFGTEGKSFVMKDSKPVYTDTIIKDGKLCDITTLKQNILGHLSGPFIQMRGYLDQYFTYQSQKDAFALWSTQPFEETTLPPITFIDNEPYEVSAFSNTINEYVNDMYYQFVLGIVPMEHFDTYINELERMGMNRYLEIYQNAYNRYLKRGEQQ